MKITPAVVDRFLIDGLIARAERTLTDGRRVGYHQQGLTELEQILKVLHHERRVIVEEMMRMPSDQVWLYDA